jgi:hypothetical protein
LNVTDLAAFKARRDAALAELAAIKGYAGADAAIFARATLDAGSTASWIFSQLRAAQETSK